MAIYWIILFVVLLFIELATVNLVSIWFAIGALAAFLVSFITDSVLLELLTFVVVSIVSLIVTLPLVKKFKNREKVVPTNLDRVIGKSATVTKDILPDKFGEVKVYGSTWTAASDEEFHVGDKVVVEKMDGVKLIVHRKEKN